MVRKTEFKCVAVQNVQTLMVSNDSASVHAYFVEKMASIISSIQPLRTVPTPHPRVKIYGTPPTPSHTTQVSTARSSAGVMFLSKNSALRKSNLQRKWTSILASIQTVISILKLTFRFRISRDLQRGSWHCVSRINETAMCLTPVSCPNNMDTTVTCSPRGTSFWPNIVSNCQP